jgi:hypothetical protein
MQSKVGNKWSEVAKHIPGRTGQQCAQRWRHKVSSSKCCTAAETPEAIVLVQPPRDTKLGQALHAHGWLSSDPRLGISSVVPYCLIGSPGFGGCQLTGCCDEHLQQLLAYHSVVIAVARFSTAVAALLQVNPNIRRDKWTAEEDAKLIELVKTFGVGRWAEIARNCDGRTDQQCMGRWRRHLDPSIKRVSSCGWPELLVLLLPVSLQHKTSFRTCKTG